jgi:hypothetical protein
MKHTFLLQPGLWQLQGYFIDEQNRFAMLQGDVQIAHYSRKWINESLVNIDDRVYPEISNQYQIAPLKDGATSADWNTKNSVIGKLKGSYTIDHQFIVSEFKTTNGLYRGAEYLEMLSNDKYSNKGYLMRGETRQAFWTAELIRVIL